MWELCIQKPTFRIPHVGKGSSHNELPVVVSVVTMLVLRFPPQTPAIAASNAAHTSSIV